MQKEVKRKNKLPEAFYVIMKPLIITLYKLWYNPHIQGKENIPKTGNILICANHVHLMDQFNMIGSTRRIVHYMAKREYFDDKKTKWFFQLSGCISVDRQNGDPEAKEKAINVLENGGAIGLFPEGTRNKQRDKTKLLPFKYGAVSLAKKTDSYIVPVGISGDYKFRSRNLYITIGKPFKVTNMELSDANNRLRNAISNLIDKSYNRAKK